MTSHVVYRAYDPDGQLLYIGMSSSLVQRQEARLIDQFQPPHNYCPGHGWSQRDEQIIALRQEGMTRYEIADELGISSRAANKAINRLLASGKIERLAPGPRNRA